jgi:hypothetical protein
VKSVMAMMRSLALAGNHPGLEGRLIGLIEGGD